MRGNHALLHGKGARLLEVFQARNATRKRLLLWSALAQHRWKLRMGLCSRGEGAGGGRAERGPRLPPPRPPSRRLSCLGWTQAFPPVSMASGDSRLASV